MTHAPLITWKDVHMATSSGIIHKLQTAACEQILNIKVQGEWDFCENRNTKFILDYANEIVMMIQNAELQ